LSRCKAPKIKALHKLHEKKATLETFINQGLTIFKEVFLDLFIKLHVGARGQLFCA
jgi:hypothetical protein